MTSPRAGRRRLAAGLSLTVVVCAAVSWGLLGTGDGARRAPEGPATAPGARAEGAPRGDPRSLAVIRRVQARQSANFSVLRTLPEGLPASTARILRQPAFGMNWALAQRLPEGADADFWAVPGNGFLCVLAQGDGVTLTASCTTTEDAIEHGVAAVLLRTSPRSRRARGRRLIVGMAPDQAREVSVHTRGNVTPVTAMKNVFTLHDSATDPPDRLVLR
jgi:hypothetical protein